MKIRNLRKRKSKGKVTERREEKMETGQRGMKKNQSIEKET